MANFLKRISLLILSGVLFLECRQADLNSPKFDGIDFRQEMRSLVIELSETAKGRNPDFQIIPQNGQELVTRNGEADGDLHMAYLHAIDATGREDLFYGYNDDDKETPSPDTQYMLDLCLLFEQQGVEVLVTDYCSTKSKMAKSYADNEKHGFISFAAPERDLNVIPAYPAVPFHENDADITHITEAKNFLYLINGEKYATKKDFISAVQATNYDMLIMDLFHNDTAYSQSDVEQLKFKNNGGRRLVICYLSIGEAEDYRYYWQKGWNTKRPAWLLPENPQWEGNFKVAYWESEWQNIIFQGEDSYLDKILGAGFDGAYLDLIDAFEYFE